MDWRLYQEKNAVLATVLGTAAGAAAPGVTATGRAPQRAQVLAAGAWEFRPAAALNLPDHRGDRPREDPSTPETRGSASGSFAWTGPGAVVTIFIFLQTALFAQKRTEEKPVPEGHVPWSHPSATKGQGTRGRPILSLRLVQKHWALLVLECERVGGRVGGGRGELPSETRLQTTALSTSHHWHQPAPQEATRSATWRNTRYMGVWMKGQKYTD